MSVPFAPNRPRSVTITFWGVIFFGVWNLGRAIAIGQELNLQQTLNIQPDPRLRLAAAGLFAVLFLGLAGNLWWKRPFTIKAIPITIAGYTVYETAVWLLISLFLIGSILFTRWSLQRAIQTYFHYEQ